MDTERLTIEKGDSVALPVAVLRWTSSAAAPMATIVAKSALSFAAPCRPATEVASALREEEKLLSDGPGIDAVADLVPMKRGLDVVVRGHVFAPEGKPVFKVTAMIRMGSFSRSLDVHGDRGWLSDGRVAALPFVRMPIEWQRSAGGPGTDNPLGVAPLAPRASDGLLVLPSFVPAGHVPLTPSDPIPVEGFGPLPASFPERRALCRGPIAEPWRDRLASGELDPSFFNCAPRAQRASGLTPGSVLELAHLHPTEALVRLTLPTLLPTARVRVGSEAKERVVPLRADTLVIDTDASTIELVYRGQMALARADEALHVSLFDMGSAASRLRAPASARQEDLRAVTLELAPPSAAARAPSPRDTSVDLAAPAAVAISTAGPEPQHTLPAMQAVVDALPFRHAAERASSPVPAVVAPPRPRPATPVPVPIAAETIGQRIAREHAAPGRPTRAEPPKIGPTPEPPALAPEKPAPADPIVESPPPNSEPAAANPPSEARVAAPFDPASFEADSFGYVKCALDLGQLPKARIYRQFDLDDDRWRAVVDHFDKRVKSDIRRGDTALRDAVDDAYVDQLEQDCGPIRPEQYAALQAAGEVGADKSDLPGLPAEARGTVRRVMIRRAARDPSLRAELDRAVEAHKLGRGST